MISPLIRAKIIAFLKAGLTRKAIMEQTGASLRTVYRVSQLIRNEPISKWNFDPRSNKVDRRKTTAENNSVKWMTG
jgi:DNA invertase Pin-like site-specific DNA recombinase